MAEFKAVILDLDGVITHTAKLHSVAWKRLFDEYNERRVRRGDKGYEPFDADRDYLLYVDGKPRQDGVRSFLESRGIHIPDGNPSDSPDKETIYGLGNLKNGYFQKALEEQGPEVFEDAITAIKAWRSQGLRTAVASSSKNCEDILRIAGITHLFEVRVDGTHLQKWKMPGKPAPNMFLAAAQELRVDPSESVVFEDAISGVEAGRNGAFGLVVGVVRHGSPELLRNAGADITVVRLTDVNLNQPGLRTQIATNREKPAKKVPGTFW